MVAPVRVVKNAEKVDLIAQIHDSRGERGIHLISELLAIMVQETRELNDTAAPDEVLQNQGRISAFRDLQDFIENGIARPDISKPHY